MTRRIAALVALAALGASLASAAVTYGPWTVLRAKANLAGSATATTSSIACLGARQVDFLIRCANADQDSLAAVGVQVSMDNANWIWVGANGVAGASQNGTGLGALGYTGKTISLWGGANSPYLLWAFARLSMTNGSAQVDSTMVDAAVLSDGGGKADLNRAAPPH